MLKASKHEASFKIRFLLRVVEDYNVDRLQVYNRDVKPSNTNSPYRFITLLYYNVSCIMVYIDKFLLYFVRIKIASYGIGS